MEHAKRLVTVGSLGLVGLGVITLAVDLISGGKLNLSLPLIFLMLGAAFFGLVYPLSHIWRWAAALYPAGALMLALGLIFLFNVITADWDSWAYAWLLIVAGLGFGVVMAAKELRAAIRWSAQATLAGVGMVILGLTFFAVFGAIAGGRFIQIVAPILLVLGGLALRQVKPELVFPEAILRRLRQKPVQPGLKTNPGQAGLVEPLSVRELEVLRLIDQGCSNAEIADRLTLAPSTVKTHINNIYGKLGVQGRVQALNRARELGLILKER